MAAIAAIALLPGTAVAAGTTERVSISTAGVQANSASADPAISADGRFAAFDSDATNLDPADTDVFADVFVRDLQANTTILVSRATGSSGVKGNSASSGPAISANGRFVAFHSWASNLGPADTNGVIDVFVRDLQANTTTLVSRATGSSGVQGNVGSSSPAISADGRFVAFESQATNLDPADTDSLIDVFVRDLQANTTTLVSRATGPSGVKGNDTSRVGAISADGRFVAFDSYATNLDFWDTDSTPDVFVRDLGNNVTLLVSQSSASVKGNNWSSDPTISADGRFVAFDSDASNLDPADTDSDSDVFVRDLQAYTTTFVSRATGSSGVEGDSFSFFATISADGRFVAFDSYASNLDPADTDGIVDVFVRDLGTNTTALVSRSSAGLKGNGNSSRLAISAGALVVFESAANNLVASDTNGVTDVFVSTDFDADLMPNDYELGHPCLSPVAFDSYYDPDFDSLPSGAEHGLGTDPCDSDTDNDARSDSVDSCPLSAEDYDGFQDSDGCPDPDNDLDGICDPGQTSVSCTVSDSGGGDYGKIAFYPNVPNAHPHGDPAPIDCRNVPEDLDGFKDADGCPEPDNDNDGFPDASDQCPGNDNVAGLNGVLGSSEDDNHNGLLDSGEDFAPLDGVLTTDDSVLTFEDYDGILDTDGCHDSPGDDRDGDGFTDENEILKIGTKADDPCGGDAWPADLAGNDNRLNIGDFNSFLFPLRGNGSFNKIFHPVPDPDDANVARWDLQPSNAIDIGDLNALNPAVMAPTARPPMFGGQPAFFTNAGAGVGVCPLPP